MGKQQCIYAKQMTWRSLQAFPSCFAAMRPYITCRMFATQSSDQMVADMIEFVRTGCQVQPQSIYSEAIVTGHIFLTLSAASVMCPVYIPSWCSRHTHSSPSSLHTGQHTASNRHSKHWFGSSNRQRAHATTTCYGRSASSKVQLGRFCGLPVECTS